MASMSIRNVPERLKMVAKEHRRPRSVSAGVECQIEGKDIDIRSRAVNSLFQARDRVVEIVRNDELSLAEGEGAGGATRVGCRDDAGDLGAACGDRDLLARGDRGGESGSLLFQILQGHGLHG